MCDFTQTREINDAQEPRKKCGICKEIKTVDNFNRKGQSCDGLQRSCSKCIKSIKQSKAQARQKNFDPMIE